jgi:aldose 1-epimerase
MTMPDTQELTHAQQGRPRQRAAGAASVRKQIEGKLPGGVDIVAWRLTNQRGTEAAILNLGATLQSLRVADANGQLDDVVLGFDTAEHYLRGREYFGATVGRYANRIANGRFRLSGTAYQLSINDAPNAEHGGAEGFDRRIWTMAGTDTTNGAALSLSLVSPDGDQGFPGELEVQLVYTLTNDDELRLDYTAQTSAPTIINLTNHSYWNLAGAGDALAAHLCIEADAYTPVDAGMIPTGEVRPVAGSVFDFRTSRSISSRIRDGADSQLMIGRGYDHNFVLRGEPGRLRKAAVLKDPGTGRVLELLTTEPGLQLYTGNFLTGAVPGKERRLYRQGDGVALETQHFPDSPNQPRFPSTVLEPGRVWTSTTIYRFLHVSHRDIAKSDGGTHPAPDGEMISAQVWTPPGMDST